MHGIGTAAVRFESGRLQERLEQLKWRKWLFRGSVLGNWSNWPPPVRSSGSRINRTPKEIPPPLPKYYWRGLEGIRFLPKGAGLPGPSCPEGPGRAHAVRTQCR